MRSWNNRQHEEALAKRRRKNHQRYIEENYEWIDADTSTTDNNFGPNVSTATEFDNLTSPMVRVKKKK